MTILPDHFHPKIKEIAKRRNISETYLRGLCMTCMEVCKREGKSKKLATQEAWDMLLSEDKRVESPDEYYEDL
jgi:hypothetical protein